jgi:hypothetical protein
VTAELRVPHISLLFREMLDTTILDQMCLLGSKVRRSKAVVSHISRKTSEIWGTPSFVAEPTFPTPSFWKETGAEWRKLSVTRKGMPLCQ